MTRRVCDGLFAGFERAFNPHAAVRILHNQRTVLDDNVVDVTSPRLDVYKDDPLVGKLPRKE